MLERSVQQLGLFRFPQLQGWFMVFLAEAHRLNGQLDHALDLARRGLQMTKAASSQYGVGWAERVLGRIAQSRGDLAEAEARFTEALGTFSSMQARYDLARTHLDLAALAHARENRDAVAKHIQEAHQLVGALGAPRRVEATRRLASELGVPLAP